jgi:excisionase family DNA binding protein
VRGSTEVPVVNPNTDLITPRLLRIVGAATYLGCTFGWIETLIREKSVPSVILGKRRLIDIRDLDAYVERVKVEQCGGVFARQGKLLKPNSEKQRAA